FPMLVFGILTLLAPLVYQATSRSAVDYVWHPAMSSAPQIAGVAFAPVQQFGVCDSTLGDPMSVALYWFCVLMFGPLASLLWYHRQARRDGTSGQTGWYLLYACTTLALYVVLFPVIEFAMLHMHPAGATPDRHGLLVAELSSVAAFVAGLLLAGFAAWPL